MTAGRTKKVTRQKMTMPVAKAVIIPRLDPEPNPVPSAEGIKSKRIFLV
jgi:hypothetical protein